MEGILFACFLILRNQYSSILEVYALVTKVFRTKPVYFRGTLLVIQHRITALSST